MPHAAAAYVASVAAHVLAGAAVGLALRGVTRERYAALPRAPWSPPAWLFGPVWTVLYALIGAALARLVLAAPRPADAPLWAHLAQMALNLAWSPVFFGLGRHALALALLVALAGAVAWEIALAWPIDAVAGALLVPYAAWLAYAASLNAHVVAAAARAAPPPAGARLA